MGSILSSELDKNDLIPKAVEVAQATETCSPIFRSSLSKELVDARSDAVYTLWDALERGAGISGVNSLFGYRDPESQSDGFTWISYREALERIEALAGGLASLGFSRSDPLGLYSVNRMEWVISEYAGYRQSGKVVSLYDTLGPDAVTYIINHAEVPVICVSSDKVEKILAVVPQCPTIKHVVQFESELSEEQVTKAEELGVSLHTYEQLLAKGRATPVEADLPKPEDLATIMYTSGTTGVPKGVLLTHANLIAFVAAAELAGIKFYTNDVHLSYLPLAHIFERVVMAEMIKGGGSVGFWRGSVLQLFEDVAMLRPTIFPSVPRLYNRLFDKVNQSVADSSWFKQWLFATALESKKWYLDHGQGPTHRLWDPLVFRKIRDKLGGRVRMLITGSAPIAPEVLQFLQACFSCSVVQGYGGTETAAGVCLTSPGDFSNGHVGAPLPCCEVRLRDVPDMQYLHTDETPRGEICVRGLNVTQGYYKNDEENVKAFDADGFFCTGDVARFNPGHGTFTIIDRKKSMFKLAHGEYLSSEYVESVYVRCPHIAQVFVYGDSLQSYLVGIVVPDPDMLKSWAAKNGMESEPYEELTQLDAVKKCIQDEMDAIAKQHQLKGFEVIKKMHLCHEAFSVENCLLTPTSKMVRNKLKGRFQEQIDAMYAEPLPERKL